MQDKKSELEELIDRYVKGQLDADEKFRLEQWMLQLDISDRQTTMLEERKIALKRRIDERLLPDESRIVRRMPRYRQAIAVAASILLIAFGGRGLLHDDKKTNHTAMNFSKARTLQISVPEEYSVLNTSGRDSTFYLLDGTRVRLLANSRLTWKVPFESYRRVLTLEGRAFFDVAHDRKRPFSVVSANIVTTALGTSFWVEQPSKGSKPRIRLLEGKVAIKEQQQDGREVLLAYLKPGQHWEEQMQKVQPLDAIKVATETKPIKQPIAASLFFHHKPLTEVLPELASFYETTIIFSAKELAGMSFYGSYDHQHRIEQILNTICLANDLTMQWDKEENKYTIHKVD
ncbi:FecR family protein [Sphingobacterium deserti]|nr:FecR domain-containing protein [Sphingobacterium deserti]